MPKVFTKIAVVFSVFVLVVVGPSTKNRAAEYAKAASLRAVPKYCLGGWENPQLAAGEGTVNQGDASAFNSENSAVLSQKSAQLYCGFFESDDKSFPPVKAVLHFSWNVNTAAHADADAATWQATISGTAANPAIINMSASSTATSSSSGSATSSLGESAATSSAPAPSEAFVPSEPVIASSTPPAPPVEPAPAASSTPAAQDIPATPPPPVQAAPVATTTSASLLYDKFISFFAPRALAQSVSGSAIFDITYTLDGKEWKNIGKVTEENWRTVTVEIPVTSWDEMSQLQVALNPVLSFDLPTVYLDSMWLEVQYDHTILDTVKEGITSAADATQSATEAVGNMINTAIVAVADKVTNAINPGASVQQASIIAAVEPEKPEFNFGVHGDIGVPMKVLPWVRSNEQKESKGDEVVRFPSLALNPAGNSFHISGSCAKPYFVVLVFANQSDYIEDPSRAIINRANPCVNGAYSYELRSDDFPKNLPDGTYYVIAGEEGARESWRPHASMYAISINRTATTTTP